MSHTVLHALAFRPKARGSFELFLLGLAARQARAGLRVHFLFDGEPVPWFASALRASANYDVAPGAPLSDPGYSKLRQLMRNLKPDLLSLTFCSLFAPRALRLARQTRTAFLDHTSWQVPKRSGLHQALAMARGALAGQCFARIISCSDLNRRRNVTQSFLPANKCVRIYNGVPDGRAMLDFPSELRARPGRYLFYAGQLARFKGVHTLLLAFERAAPRAPADVRLVLAGAGPDERELKELASQSTCRERVDFLGQRDDVAALMTHSLATVVPSEWHEAFGLVVAEAMANGALVIASDAGAIPEVLADAGLLFPRGSVAALAGALEQVMLGRADRAARVEAARSRAAQYFSLERMVEGYAREFEIMLDERPPTPLLRW